eukprot:CAMPEP_0170188172 /NCGR_PEP_ID=MMETSP0040_2-20121228/43655_1 /TAXON_ID=641309 /ORGANISM="Lotharella oceanica, Strain CCMP622" /LENGTH=33 /DNA_ID= /DNA_START= /DNA_END= /DNA_ORIENTATION=
MTTLAGDEKQMTNGGDALPPAEDDAPAKDALHC